MFINNNNRRPLLEICILLVILAITFFVTFYSHLGYPYPIHHDEWMHMAYSEAVEKSNSITYVDPFYGRWTFMGHTGSLEIGFYILMSLVQKATGIGFQDLFVYLPSFFFCFTVLAVYMLARRAGFGLEAAFFTSLLPTSTGLLGPVFWVPLSLAMFLIPVILFLGFNGRQFGSYVLLFVLTCFLILLHPPSAVIALILLVPFIIINLKKDVRHFWGMVITVVAPFLVLYIYLVSSSFNLESLLSASSNDYIRFPNIINSLGLFVVIFGFLGCIALFIKNGSARWGILFGFAALLLVLLFFVRLNIGADIIYQRGLVYLQLILSIIAGAGLAWLGSLALRTATGKIKVLAMNLGKVLAIISAGIIMITIVPARVNADFYHMIDSSDNQGFTWIGQNLGQQYKVALLDPWKATAFSAIANKLVVRRIFQQREPVDDSIDAFLKNGCENSAVVRDTGIDIIYNTYDCNNVDLNKIRDRVYILNSTTGNLLQNSGFERLAADPTYPWKNESLGCKPEYLYAGNGINNSHTIGIRLKENELFGPTVYALWAEEIPVKPGAEYDIGGYIKTENIVTSAGAEILAYWVGENWESDTFTRYMTDIKGTTEWTFYKGSITAPVQATHCRVICMIAGGSGTAWFDDLIFYEK